MAINIRIDVTVRTDGEWHGQRGEAEATVTTEADAKTLFWEQICANLVQAAIERYEAALVESGDSGEDENAE